MLKLIPHPTPKPPKMGIICLLAENDRMGINDMHGAVSGHACCMFMSFTPMKFLRFSQN